MLTIIELLDQFWSGWITFAKQNFTVFIFYPTFFSLKNLLFDGERVVKKSQIPLFSTEGGSLPSILNIYVQLVQMLVVFYLHLDGSLNIYLVISLTK